MLNLYGYPSEISIADFGYILYLGNDKASMKCFNARFVSYKNKKDVNNFVTKFYFSQINGYLHQYIK